MSLTFSVIIPCYNQGRFLKEAVSSVLEQTFQDFEIIIVNDHSSDVETNHILSNFEAPKTTIISLDENHGVSFARNAGIKAAKGKYILPLDADDKIAPTYLEKAFNILEQNNSIGIVYCKAELFGKQTGEWELKKYSLKQILNDNCIFVSACFRKSAWEKAGGFNENMLYSLEDWDFWLSLIENGCDVFQIPEILFFYRKHSISRTIQAIPYSENSFEQLILNHLPLFSKNVRHLKKRMLATFFNKEIRKKIKSKNLTYYRYYFKYLLHQFFWGFKAYLLFPIYICRIYELLKKGKL